MPRFVILEHDWPQLHWDLMLEAGEALRTWRLPSEPRLGASEGELSFPHRMMYLDYEGPISGGRGSVRRWDAGEFEWENDEPNCIVVRLAGQRLKGRLELRYS